MMDYDSRINKTREIMARDGIDGIFLCPSGDAEYLSGVRRQRPAANHSHLPGDWLYGLFLSLKHAIYATPTMPLDFVMAQTEGKKFISEIMVMNDGEDSESFAVKIIRKLGLEKGVLAVPKTCYSKTLINLKKLFPDMSFTSTEDFTLDMRMVKEPEELDLMRKAARMTDAVFESVAANIKVGMTEIDVAAEVDYQIRLKGGEGTSFETGVMVTGPGMKKTIETLVSATSARLAPGTTLSFDLGMVYEGYNSDFGRTLFIGEPTKKMREVHRLVMDSQKAAMAAMIPGKITAEGLNRVARDVIEKAGFGKEFVHRLGHGIGIDLHEYPYLDVGYKQPLRANMTFTVEPSIIITNEFWVRVEDVVVVTPEGGESFNQMTRDIMVID
jgi:Xaa-Pro aminopeptidase